MNRTGTNDRDSDITQDKGFFRADGITPKPLKIVAHPTGFEPVASAFGGQSKRISERREALITGAFAAEHAVNRALLLGHNTDMALSPAAIDRLEMRARLPGIAFPERSDLLIYVIGSAKGPVKIGISCNPLKRLQQLQTSTANKLAVLAFVPGTYEHEKALHTFYHRERLTGEWFRRSKRLVEFIAELARHPDIINEIERLRGEA